jgi:hypothetical protein
MNEESRNMDCFQFAGLVHDLGRHRRLDASARDAALAHSNSCARCARLLAEVESLDAALRSVVADQAGERAGKGVETALLAEFVDAKNRAGRRSTRWQLAAVAAVAVLLLTAGWAALRFAPGTDRARQGIGVSGTSNAVKSAPAVGSGQSDAVVAQNESGGTFVRLPYASDGRVVEDDAIVRAVLPRSALASLGFPVGDVNATEPVPVELMMSEDGTPEAIRLVSQDVAE